MARFVLSQEEGERGSHGKSLSTEGPSVWYHERFGRENQPVFGGGGKDDGLTDGVPVAEDQEMGQRELRAWRD